jgi:hypothetical protein
MIVRLRKKSTRYPDLSPKQDYVVIGIEAGDLRVLNDQGQPYLYPRRLFQVVDARQPADWVRETGEDGEQYAYPPPFAEPGFFEDFFDRRPRAVATFWKTLNRRLSAAAAR